MDIGSTPLLPQMSFQYSLMLQVFKIGHECQYQRVQPDLFWIRQEKYIQLRVEGFEFDAFMSPNSAFFFIN